MEKRFGFIVRDTKKEILQDEEKIRELPDIIEYGLPLRLKGLRNFVTHTSLTRDNFNVFFEGLERMWSFIDYDLLQTIIYGFENEELIERVEAYVIEVETFCAETTIYDFIQCWKPRYENKDIPEELVTCVTELSIDHQNNTVKELKKIQQKLKNSFPQELAMAAFYICSMRPGSLIVSWLVWADCFPYVMDKLQHVLQSRSEIITDIDLSYISLDNVILYSSYNDQVTVCVVCKFKLF